MTRQLEDRLSRTELICQDVVVIASRQYQSLWKFVVGWCDANTRHEIAVASETLFLTEAKIFPENNITVKMPVLRILKFPQQTGGKCKSLVTARNLDV